MALTLTPLAGIPMIQAGDDLSTVVLQALTESNLILQNGDVLVLAQKIVSKSEGRAVKLTDIEPSAEANALALETDKDPRLVELILQESNEVVRIRPGLIISEHRHGYVCANAGIDHSNVDGIDGHYLLLPLDSDASARQLRDQIKEMTQTQIAVLIIDSHGRAWRIGTVGVAIGLAGMPALVDLRGEHDLFGYELKVSEVAAADELAAAASLMMGQGNEGTPVVHVRGFPFELREAELAELIRAKDKDLFR